MPFDLFDEAIMQRALDLAEATAGLASPNPQVGCVLTRDNTILGEGAHWYDQRDHAEIVALKQAASLGHDTAGSTAYVTLEPCSHLGRTGPCADALIAAGIARCVVATLDPNPRVSGQGIAKLRAAGIEVEIGLYRQEAQTINNAFAWSIQHGLPMVTLKAALSVDGHLAPPPKTRTSAQPHWLTGPLARAEVHRLRHASDALLTGIGTVLADNPLLTDRSNFARRRPLMRVVLDPQLRLPLDTHLVQTIASDLWIFCSESARLEQATKYEDLLVRGAILTALPGPRLDLHQVLAELAKADLRSVLLEAGPTLNGAFLSAALVQKAVLFYSETELGPGSLPFAAGQPSPFLFEQTLKQVVRTTFGPDACVSGLLNPIWPPSTSPALPALL